MTPKTIYRQWNEINTTYVSIKSLTLNGREGETKANGREKVVEREKLDLIVSSRGLEAAEGWVCVFFLSLACSLVCQKPFNVGAWICCRVPVICSDTDTINACLNCWNGKCAIK